MRNFFSVLLFFVSSFSFGQDSIQVTFTGKIVETGPKRLPIANTSVEFKLTGALQIKKSILTDSIGNYEVSFQIPSTHSKVFISISAENSGYMSRFVMGYKIPGKDTVIRCFADLSKSRICIDSWLPQPIKFSSVYCDSALTPLDELKGIIKFYQENPGFLEKRKFTVTAYCSYHEKEKAAACRAEKIKEILLQEGMDENDFIILIGGKTDFAHYYHTNGCFTKEEAEKHLMITKKAYKTAKDESAKQGMKFLRQSVYFSWTNRTK